VGLTRVFQGANLLWATMLIVVSVANSLHRS
jgi:hypothetical protein